MLDKTGRPTDKPTKQTDTRTRGDTETRDENQLQLVWQEIAKMLQYFYATECPPCKRLKNFFYFAKAIFSSCEFRVEMMPLNENDNESVYVNEKSVLQVEKSQSNAIMHWQSS